MSWAIESEASVQLSGAAPSSTLVAAPRLWKSDVSIDCVNNDTLVLFFSY